MKQIVIFMGFILFLFAAVVSFSNAEPDSAEKSQLERLDNSVFKNPHRPGALFEHDDHNDMAQIDDCAVCHHVYDGKKLLEDESSEDSQCSECHSLKSDDENSVPLLRAYHKRCKDCHFEVNKGPVLCGECHIK
ncbi:acidic tetraheme cytochrome c3 TmcA [Desulfobacula phenolica]|uniref:Class III cytochrome C family protein n=1 Tax=Desulfobacula phenolica TaxID=90732 RepID=A0A1H2G925_9BACT|nr:cytochrome c3 family protein [Desulfobacula phenolica]SDU16072.1 Class III cytochrome C family protein [Desulfobacula phenolica]